MIDKQFPIIQIFLISILILTGCNSSSKDKAVTLLDAAPRTSSSTTITLADRSYLLDLPNNFSVDKSYKLLLVFHGSGGNSAGMQTTARFAQLSDDYLVAYPKSKVEEWNEGCDCNKPNRLGIDDLAFVDDVITNIQQHYTILPDEIYAAGFSQGALFSQNLLCNRGEKFKAIASIAAPMSLPLSQSCTLEKPTSFMMVHGTSDPVLPYDGLKHPNWALVSSPFAVKLLANKNASLVHPIVKMIENTNIELTAYSNGNEKTHLYSVKNGGHQWNFKNFTTSKEILTFFDGLEKPELPINSQLVNVNEKTIHVHTMGEDKSGPAIILLAGMNKNYFSDSAWYSLLQTQLANDYRVHNIDRSGNAWGSYDTEPSYHTFVDDLYQTLITLGESEVIFVSLSGANITSRLFAQKYADDDKLKLKSMLWIDPDIFLPHSISLYQGYPVDWYREKLDLLLPRLEDDFWTERTQVKLDAEREELTQLINEPNNNDMNWQYYNLVSQLRLLTNNQKIRALEIANYHDDLNAVKDLPLITDLPISVINSDFEASEIANDPENAESLSLWMEEGTTWSKEVAEVSGGQYIELMNADHMVPMQHPDVIITAINWLFQQD